MYTIDTKKHALLSISITSMPQINADLWGYPNHGLPNINPHFGGLQTSFFPHIEIERVEPTVALQ